MARRPAARRLLSHALKANAKSSLDVRAIGRPREWGFDLYHRLVDLSWPGLGLLFFTIFLLFNVGFAGIYMTHADGFAGESVHGALTFPQAFFFSVHTVATIGYGNIFPRTEFANWMVVIEITLGILFFALATGIAFARFSRPYARILFSRVAVVAPVDGVPTLMFRAANQRHNLIFEAKIRATVLRDTGRMRRFFDLALTRAENPVFALTWLVMHPIDGDSPLHSWLEERRAHAGDELVVVLAGEDDSTGQTIHGRWAYTADDICWGKRFGDILGTDPNGRRTIDYRRFDEVIDEDAVDPNAESGARQ